MELREIIKRILDEQLDALTNPDVVDPELRITPTKPKSDNTTSDSKKSVNIDFVNVNQDLIDAYGIDAVKRAYENAGITVKQEGDKLQIKGLLPKSTYFSSPYRFGRDPKSHQEYGSGDGWQSLNAWDFEAPVGTNVYSLTNGKVIKKHDSNTDDPNIWGEQMTIQGIGGYPSVFYTHIKSPLEVGSEVSVGSLIGTIVTPKSGGSHVHIGLPYGYDISSLLI